MSKVIAKLMALFAVVVIVSYLINLDHEHLHKHGLAVGDKLDLSAPIHSFDGNTWSLSNFSGRPIVVNLWSSSCAICIKELPIFSQLAQQFVGQAYVIGLTVFSPDAKVAQIIREKNITFPTGKIDHDLAHKWGAETVPMTYILNSSGSVVFIQSGMVKKADLESILNKLIKKEAK